jgi:hypothetical protein
MFTCLPSLVAAQLDAPSIEFVDADRSSIVMTITAGTSGAPSGFTVEWMKRSDYEAIGWPSDPDHPALTRCEFTGTPTLTTTSGVAGFNLDPSVDVRVEVGDFFDETGVYTDYLDELPIQSEYAFRVFARPTDGMTQSDPSATLQASTDDREHDCIFSQGFWKNHPELWPIASMQLGSNVYTASQLLDIFHEPARGNGLVFLSHQLIAAKLNIGNGADPAPIQSVIDAADILIGSKVVPPIGSGYVKPRNASALTEELDRFNNGKIETECQTVAVEDTGWSDLKTRYR